MSNSPLKHEHCTAVRGSVEESILHMERSSRKEVTPCIWNNSTWKVVSACGNPSTTEGCMTEGCRTTQFDLLKCSMSEADSLVLPASCWGCNNLRIGHGARIYKVENSSSSPLCKDWQKRQQVVQHSDRRLHAVYLLEARLINVWHKDLMSPRHACWHKVPDEGAIYDIHLYTMLQC